MRNILTIQKSWKVNPQHASAEPLKEANQPPRQNQSSLRDFCLSLKYFQQRSVDLSHYTFLWI